MSTKSELSVSLDDILESQEYASFFPALDFKFYNASSVKMMINNVTLRIKRCVVDIDPSLEIGLTCDTNGNLCAQIYNFGWGDIHELILDVTLNSISRKLEKRRVTVGTVPQSEIEDEAFTSRSVPLIHANELTDDDVETYIRLPTLGRDREAKEYGPPPGGLNSLPTVYNFKDELGNESTKQKDIARIQRGAYDWKVISFSDGRFVYVQYDEGIRYSLIPPSVSYHALINPDEFSREIDLSTALAIEPKSFERAYLVIGALKSVKASLSIGFKASSGTILTEQADIEIWNPRNSFFSSLMQSRDYLSFGQLREVDPHKMKHLVQDYKGRKVSYDIAKYKSNPTITWGY